MRKLQLIFAVLGLGLVLNACAPEEEVQPQADQPVLEKFESTDNDGSGGRNEPYLPPKN